MGDRARLVTLLVAVLWALPGAVAAAQQPEPMPPLEDVLEGLEVRRNEDRAPGDGAEARTDEAGDPDGAIEGDGGPVGGGQDHSGQPGEGATPTDVGGSDQPTDAGPPATGDATGRDGPVELEMDMQPNDVEGQGASDEATTGGSAARGGTIVVAFLALLASAVALVVTQRRYGPLTS